ncbi:MAG: sigma-70 family RNA polymerase sigma factor [Proteobacteria bacterium]|nr:sigma-70 family RNA polymerase sigma factor [Pseudomonadota bacterium]
MPADQAVTRYIERVRGVPVLNRETEHQLAVRARQGDVAAGHRLVEANLRFAVAVAIRFRHYGIPLAELIAEGNLGLAMAVRKFDPTRGTRFVTYAGYWIRALVLDLVVRSTSMVGGGSGVLRSKVFFRLRRERARISNLIGDEEQRNQKLARRFNVKADKMRAMLLQLDARDSSLDVPAYPEGNLTLLDLMADHGAGQEQTYLNSEREHILRRELGAALSTLDKRERFIVERRIMGDEEESLAELGRQLGVSRERARQLEARAKRKLRERLKPEISNAA